jgi:hypothetical protein
VSQAADALISLLQKSFQAKSIGPISHASEGIPSKPSDGSEDKSAEKGDDADVTVDDDLVSISSDIPIEESVDGLDPDDRERRDAEVDSLLDRIPPNTPIVSEDAVVSHLAVNVDGRIDCDDGSKNVDGCHDGERKTTKKSAAKAKSKRSHSRKGGVSESSKKASKKAATLDKKYKEEVALWIESLKWKSHAIIFELDSFAEQESSDFESLLSDLETLHAELLRWVDDLKPFHLAIIGIKINFHRGLYGAAMKELRKFCVPKVFGTLLAKEKEVVVAVRKQLYHRLDWTHFANLDSLHDAHGHISSS